MRVQSDSVASRMVPISRVFALSVNAPITHELLVTIANTAHSRVPVHAAGDTSCIVGLLLVKSLLRIQISPASPPLVGSLPLITPLIIDPSATMLDALRTFRARREHMALISDRVVETTASLTAGMGTPPGIQGLITLEDCLLAVLNSTDPISDGRDMARIVATASRQGVVSLAGSTSGSARTL